MQSNNLISEIQTLTNKFLDAQSNEVNLRNQRDQFKKSVSTIIKKLAKVEDPSLLDSAKAFDEMVHSCKFDDFFDTGIALSVACKKVLLHALRVNSMEPEMRLHLLQLEFFLQKNLAPVDWPAKVYWKGDSTGKLRNKTRFKYKHFMTFIETLLVKCLDQSSQGNHQKALATATRCFEHVQVGLRRWLTLRSCFQVWSRLAPTRSQFWALKASTLKKCSLDTSSFSEASTSSALAVAISRLGLRSLSGQIVLRRISSPSPRFVKVDSSQM